MSSYRIEPYDTQWPLLARDEMARIGSVLGLPATHIEHIGSTAVPGLGAKPIIDLMVGVPGLVAMVDKRPVWGPLRSLGYEFRGTETAPGTLYIRKADPRRFNLHMTEYGGAFWTSHLLFRDRLRADATLARRYEDLKRKLIAGLGPDPDRSAYNDGKTAFIESVCRE